MCHLRHTSLLSLGSFSGNFVPHSSLFYPVTFSSLQPSFAVISGLRSAHFLMILAVVLRADWLILVGNCCR